MNFTQNFVKSLFSYDKYTGFLYWKERPEDHFKSFKGFKVWNGKYSKKLAGAVHTNQNGKKYITVSINSKRYLAHRIIWLLVTGENPNNEIDHINGNGIDNRIENLRHITRKENNKNLSISVRNKTGVVGVHWDKKRKVFKAEIRAHGKNKFLGYFKTIEEAAVVRKKAEKKLGYHKNHGT